MRRLTLPSSTRTLVLLAGVLAVADAVTTVLGLRVGFTEHNPVAAWLFTTFTPGVVMAVSVPVTMVGVHWVGSWRRWAGWVCVGWKAWTVLGNLLVLTAYALTGFTPS